MSRSIELDADIYDFLKSQAEPFVDTPSTVLRRLLHLGDDSAADPSRTNGDGPVRRGQSTARAKKRGGVRKANGRSRAPSGSLLPEQRYELPLLRALIEAGGEAPFSAVRESVGRALSDELTPADHETLTSGGVRWHSRLQFVRLRLIERGELDRDAPRGIWRITEAGRQAALNGAAS
jgi:hypothetical protein